MKRMLLCMTVMSGFTCALPVSASDLPGNKDAQLSKASASSEQPLSSLLKNAQTGDANSQYELGQLYAHRKAATAEDRAREDKEAQKWYRKAAEQGHPAAQYWLGMGYYFKFLDNKNSGEKQDANEAIKWIRSSAEQGYADAQSTLGGMYSDRDSVYASLVKYDPNEAAKWFRKAADQGYADAQNRLGLMYSMGEGVEEDAKEALKWKRKAAVNGNQSAQYHIGESYRKGDEVAQDYKVAAKWFLKAAVGEQDSIWARFAQSELMIMYFNGEGVPKDYVASYRWCLIAEKNGADVSEEKERLEVRLTSEQISTTEQQAKAFLRQHQSHK